MKLGLTYNDVLLVPKKTSLNSRSEADTKTFFTKHIKLNIPLVSSNMATVTEHKMAIAMAREGGLGIIHQFGTIEEQVEEEKQFKERWGSIYRKILLLDQSRGLTQEELLNYGQHFLRMMKIGRLNHSIVRESPSSKGVHRKSGRRDRIFRTTRHLDRAPT